MPTVFVKGKQVPVSDDFFNLPPEEQEATVQRIADQIAFEAIIGLHRPGNSSTNISAKADRELSAGEYAEDAVKSFGVGVAKGGIGLAGLGGDVREGILGASNLVAEKLGTSPENAKWFTEMARDGLRTIPVLPLLSGPTSAELTDIVRQATAPAPTVTQLVTGDRPQSFIDRRPRSTLGEYAQTTGEFAPAALAGPGGIIRKTAMTVIPAALSETGGQVVRASGHEEYEPWARLGGALLGGGLVFANDLLRLAKPPGAALDAERLASTEPAPLAVKVRPKAIKRDAKSASPLDDIDATAGRKHTAAGHDIDTTPMPTGASGKSDLKKDFVRPLRKSLGNDSSARTSNIANAKLPQQHFLTEGLERKRHNYPPDQVITDDIAAHADATMDKIYTRPAIAAGKLRQSTTTDAKQNIFEPPTRPQRPFEADFPNGAITDEAGNLLVDKYGNPLIAKYRPGRRTLGGGDIGLSHGEFHNLGEDLIKGKIEVVPHGTLGRNGKSLGEMSYIEATNEPRAIRVVDNLSKKDKNLIKSHEAAHAVDVATGRQPIDTPEMQANLERIYSDLATGIDRGLPLTLPSSRGYGGTRTRDELMGEGFRAAITNPNYFKSVAPKTYDILAERIRNSKIAHLLQLNSLAAAAAAGLGLLGRREDSQAGGLPRPSDVRQGPPERDSPTPPPAIRDIANALIRRDLSPQAPKKGEFHGLVKALIESRRAASPNSGPRL